MLALYLPGVGDSSARASFALTYHVLEWVTTCSIGFVCLGQLGLSLGELSRMGRGSSRRMVPSAVQRPDLAAMVAQVVDDLPAEFRDVMDNVEVVEDWLDAETMRRPGVGHPSRLLGPIMAYPHAPWPQLFLRSPRQDQHPPHADPDALP